MNSNLHVETIYMPRGSSLPCTTVICMSACLGLGHAIRQTVTYIHSIALTLQLAQHALSKSLHPRVTLDRNDLVTECHQRILGTCSLQVCIEDLILACPTASTVDLLENSMWNDVFRYKGMYNRRCIHFVNESVPEIGKNLFTYNKMEEPWHTNITKPKHIIQDHPPSVGLEQRGSPIQLLVWQIYTQHTHSIKVINTLWSTLPVELTAAITGCATAWSV